MKRYLLDTNIISDLARNGEGSRAYPRLSQAAHGSLVTSLFVEAEIRFGLAKNTAPNLARRVDAVMRLLPVVAPDPVSFSGFYAMVRSRLESLGKPIGAMDTLIAAHCLELSKHATCVLVTDNADEFTRVAGLEVENWI